MLSILGSVVVSIISKVLDPGNALSKWSERKDAIQQAKVDAEIAKITAEAQLAAYKLKADVEWDLKWADNAQTSWKDEWLVVLWSIPLVGVFIPGIRPYVIDGFEYLKLFNPDAPFWFMAGWAIIFAATFGIKQAVQIMMPSRVAGLVAAIGNVSDDIPDAAVDKATAIIQKLDSDPEVAPKPKKTALQQQQERAANR